MKKLKCKAVFFDLWDTLLTTRHNMRRMQKLMGLGNKSFGYFIKRFEKATMMKSFASKKDFFKAGFLIFGLKYDKRIAKKIIPTWEKNTINSNPFPETIHALRTLKKRGFKLAIVSNCQYFGMRKLLKRFGFDKIFDLILLSFEAHSLKPEPKMFKRALKKLGLKPREAIMVGDSLTDLVGARNAKMRAVLLDRHAHKKKHYKAVAVINSLSKLLEILGVEKNGNR